MIDENEAEVYATWLDKENSDTYIGSLYIIEEDMPNELEIYGVVYKAQF